MQIKTMIGKKSKQTKQLKFGVGGAAVLSLLLTTGCTSLSENTTDQYLDSVQPQIATQVDASEQRVTSSGMTASVIAQILTAELLVEKGLPAKAFELLYPLAEQTRDAGLVERAFHLSMTTYQEADILKATQLWLEVEPEKPTPWRAAYLMSLRQGKLDLAIEQWDKYRALSEVSPDNEVLSAAQRIARSAKADVALPFFEKVVSQYSELWQSYYSYGVLASHYQQYVLAEQVLNKALLKLETAEPDKQVQQKATKQVYHLLSKVYLQFTDPKIGLKVLNRYLENNQEDWLVQERVARLEVKAELLSEAEKRYQVILQANPEASTSRLSLALLQIELEKFPEATANLKQISEQKAYASVGFYYLGVLSQEQDQMQSAIEYFEKVKADPYRVDAQLHIAEITFPIKGAEAAIAVLDAIEVTDKKSQVKLLRAKAIFYRANQDLAQSIEMYEQALNIAPNNQQMLLAQAVLFYDLQRYDGYERNLYKVLELQPDSVDALNALGYFYVEQGERLEEATKLLEKALELDPGSYYVLDSVGWLNYQLQDYAKAENYLRQALAIKLDEEVVIHLVATLWQLGKTQQAKALWQKNLASFSKNKRYQMLIENLQSGVPIK
ncbi:MAG: tetratricopeptide repeat protein [Pseudomonadota bacterium]|nr:tetratricopeptide repeat protein [Pseudomonadota bacterium]